MTSIVTTRKSEFRRDGYTVLNGAIRHELITAAHDEYNEILLDRASTWTRSTELNRSATFLENIERLLADPVFDPGQLADIEVAMPYKPLTPVRSTDQCSIGRSLVRLMTEVASLDFVRETLGSEVSASPNQHSRIKPPAGTGSKFGATGWHQDAVTHLEASRLTEIVTFWIPLVDVPVEKGCLMVVPGAHLGSKPLSWPVTPEEALDLEARAVAVPAMAGDVVVLHKNLPHAGLPNRTACVRWNFDVRLYPSDQPSDRPWYPSAIVATDSYCVDPDDLARKWQHATESARDELFRLGGLCPGSMMNTLKAATELASEWETGNVPEAPLVSR